MTKREKEQKERDDFHGQNYPDKELSLSPASLKKAEENAKKEVVKEKEKPKNFDANYIEQEVFDKELAYLPVTPLSDLVFVLGPRVEAPKEGAIKIDERAANELLDERLKQLGASFRVIAISPFVMQQRLQMMKGLEGTVAEGFQVGDYVTWQAPLRLLKTFAPDDVNLAYYEVRNGDIRYFTTQAVLDNFKPVAE